MNDIDACLKKAERAVKELKLTGVKIHSNMNGVPLDDKLFKPLFK